MVKIPILAATPSVKPTPGFTCTEKFYLDLDRQTGPVSQVRGQKGPGNVYIDIVDAAVLWTILDDLF